MPVQQKPPYENPGRPFLGSVTAAAQPNEPADKRFIRIVSPSLDNPIEVLLGPTPPVPSGGGGGFEKKARARNVSMTSFSGFEGFSMDVEVMLDNTLRTGVMNPQQLLDRILKVYRTSDEEEPDHVVVYGRALPLNGWKWVLNGIGWGATNRDRDGRLKRQVLTLTLEEYVKGKNIKFKRRKKSGGGGKTRRYEVKNGDTLYSIAKKFYDDRDQWKKIAERNDLRGPRSVKPGDVLIIP